MILTNWPHRLNWTEMFGLPQNTAPKGARVTGYLQLILPVNHVWGRSHSGSVLRSPLRELHKQT